MPTLFVRSFCVTVKVTAPCGAPEAGTTKADDQRPVPPLKVAAIVLPSAVMLAELSDCETPTGMTAKHAHAHRATGTSVGRKLIATVSPALAYAPLALLLVVEVVVGATGALVSNVMVLPSVIVLVDALLPAGSAADAEKLKDESLRTRKPRACWKQW